MAKIDEKRWQVAQKNEQDFWENDWKGDLDKNEELSKKYWDFHVNILNKHVEISDNTKILEIGGAVTPMVNFIEKGEKYSLDPLMDYFKEKFDLKKGINYITAKGEDIPFEDKTFDIVLITNVIDHVHNYKDVLNEIKRVLKDDGLVYLSVDCHMHLLKLYKDYKEKIGYGDACHPHAFTLKSARKSLRSIGFEIIESLEGIGDQGIFVNGNKEQKTSSSKIKNTLKNRGVLGLADSGIHRTLNKIGKHVSPEKDSIDFIFILKK
jgi:ubiquinone/menaquinone biosynthesis C-methylase UbiE